MLPGGISNAGRLSIPSSVELHSFSIHLNATNSYYEIDAANKFEVQLILLVKINLGRQRRNNVDYYAL
jgi:hypothetical protein